MRILFILFALSLASCQKSEIVVNKILVDRLEGAETLPFDRSELNRWIQASLSSHGKMVFRPGDKDGGLLRVKIGVAMDSARNQPNRVYLSTQFLRSEEEGLQEIESSTWVSFESSKEWRAEFRMGLERNLDNILGEIEGQKVAGLNAIQKIKEYTNGKDLNEHEVMIAIQRVGQEKDQLAVAPLIKALKRPNLKIAIKAVVALGQIGEVNSVDAITDFAERKSPEIRRHAIEAARKIGGRKAAAWLFTLSTGHQDGKVRSAALMALKDVERRMESVRPQLEASAKDFLSK